MKDRRDDFELTLDAAETIIDTLGFDWESRSRFEKTPSDVCKVLNIDRRTFNSVVSKAIFAVNATDAQKMLRSSLYECLGTICLTDELNASKEKKQ